MILLFEYLSTLINTAPGFGVLAYFSLFFYDRLAKGVQIIVKAAVKNGRNYWRFLIYPYVPIWPTLFREILEATETPAMEIMATILLWINSLLAQNCLSNFVLTTKKVCIKIHDKIIKGFVWKQPLNNFWLSIMERQSALLFLI